MNKTTFLAMIVASALGMSACSASITTGNNAGNTNKPANTANNASNSGNSSNSNSGNSNSTSNSKKEIKDEKAEKPAGETKKQKNAPTIPTDWVYYADSTKGYGFSLPSGSVEGESGRTDNGVDYFTAETPQKISVIVYAFKDSSLTKDDLLDRAVSALEAMGEKVTPGKLTGESEDYAVGDATSESKDGTKSTLKILVGTDVTDNYVMIVRSATADFEKNKATMDMIWGSFEMYSGGASGNN